MKYSWRSLDNTRNPSEKELRVISCDFSATHMDTTSSSVLPYPKRSMTSRKRFVDFTCQAKSSDSIIFSKTERSKTGFAYVPIRSVQSPPPKKTSPRTALTHPPEKKEMSEERASHAKMEGKMQTAKGSIYKEAAEKKEEKEIKDIWPKKQVAFSDTSSSFKEDGYLRAYKQKLLNQQNKK